MENTQDFRPGCTQQTAVKVAKDITTALLEILDEYGSVLEQLEQPEQFEDPLDFYDELLTAEQHIKGHSMMLGYVLTFLDFGWSSKLSTQLKNSTIPEL